MDRCVVCGKVKSKYNKGSLCYSCDDATDDWEEMVRLPDIHVWELYPPPEKDESLYAYVKRLVHTSGGYVPIYDICRHWGFKKGAVDSVVGRVKRFYSLRGMRMASGTRGQGYRIVRRGA